MNDKYVYIGGKFVRSALPSGQGGQVSMPAAKRKKRSGTASACHFDVCDIIRHSERCRVLYHGLGADFKRSCLLHTRSFECRLRSREAFETFSWELFLKNRVGRDISQDELKTAEMVLEVQSRFLKDYEDVCRRIPLCDRRMVSRFCAERFVDEWMSAEKTMCERIRQCILRPVVFIHYGYEGSDGHMSGSHAVNISEYCKLLRKWLLQPGSRSSMDLNTFRALRAERTPDLKCMSNKLRYKVLQRDGFSCNACGRKQENGRRMLYVRRRKKNTNDRDPSDLFTICSECEPKWLAGRLDLNRWGYDKEAVKQERKKLNSALRKAVFARDGCRCVLCGRSESSGVKLVVDHIRPVAQGGKSVLSNLRVLCSDCNSGKLDEWDMDGEY